jgi:anaerobic magnesium-protoporphyrin IX monomethyl ester cyclase
MDVVLIQPKNRLSRGPYSRGQRTSLPLGLLAVATPLVDAGYKVRIIDQRLEPDWEKSLLTELETRPVCIGVTGMTGSQLWWALKASELVKRNSDAPVVWGGVHPSLLPRQTLENPNIDIVVEGEGEETFLELLRALGKHQPLAQIKGIWYKEGGQIRQNPSRPFIDLNQQPPLAYHLVDLKTYVSSVSGRDALRFETSRGCPFTCTFCYNNFFNHRQWRSFSVEQTLNRMKRAVSEYGVKGFQFSDDNFFTDPDRAHQILEGMVREKMDVFWGKGDIRLDLLSQMDDDFLSLIERSGCISLVIGVESGSQRMADLLRKEIEVEQAIEVNRRLARYSIQPRYLFMIGAPGETEEDLAETASMMLKLVDENPRAGIGVQIFVPYPGTELFDIAVQNGLPMPQRLEDWIPYNWINRHLEYPWLTAKRRSLLRMLSFCGIFLAQDHSLTMFSYISPIVSAIARVYSPLARSRIRRLDQRFLLELKMAEWLGFRGY